MRLVFAFSLCLFALFAAFETGFEPSGAFVSPQNARVLAFDAKKASTLDDVKDFAVELPHTDGQLTVAVIYAGGGAPKQMLTNSKDFLSAVGAIYAGPAAWRFRVDIDTNGAVQIIDCEERDSSDFLCDGRGITQVAQSSPVGKRSALATGLTPIN